MKREILTAALALAAMLAVSMAVMPHAAKAQVAQTSLTETFLNQDPDPAQPGRYVDLRWKVEKLGNNQLNNITYTLIVGYPFSFDESDTPVRNLGNWEGFSGSDEFAVLYYKVRVDDDAIEGTYKVKLGLNVEGSDSYVEKEYDVRVGDKERPDFVLGQLTTSPTKLTADIDEAELDLDIANAGEGDAENVVVDMELPEGFTPSYTFSDRQALGTIAAGSSKTASFFVDIAKDVPGGLHHATVRISYKEASDTNGVIKTKVLPLDILVKDRPYFEVTKVETSPAAVMPGSSVEMRVFVTDIGGKAADSVSLRAFKESSQPFSFNDKSDFIGKIEPNETGEAVLSLTIDNDAATKTYLIDLEIRAVDGDEVIVQDVTVPMQIGLAGGSGGTGAVSGLMSPLVLGTFVVALAIIGYGAYRLGRRGSVPIKPR
jgi:hypothetical protein